MPDGDVLLHAGDLTDDGNVDEIEAWLNSLSHERIIVTPGNHDIALEGLTRLRAALAKRYPRATTLIDQETVVGDLRVYGSPWMPGTDGMAFGFPLGQMAGSKPRPRGR